MELPEGFAERGEFLQGSGYVLAAAVLWGTTGTAQALAPTGAQPLAVGAVRLAIGGAALLLLALARGAFRHRRAWPKAATLFGAGSMAAYQVFFFAAVDRTGVAVGTMVVIGSAPVIAGLISLVMGERPSRRWLAATMLAVLGCSLLISAGNSLQAVDVAGILLALGAGTAYAVSTLASKAVVVRQPPEAAMAIIFTLGGLLLLPLLFFVDLSWLADPRGLGVALHLGLVATMAAYWLFGRGLMTVTAATAVTLALAEPLTAATLGIVLLGEPVTLTVLLGMGLIFTGLALLANGRQASKVSGIRNEPRIGAD